VRRVVERGRRAKKIARSRTLPAALIAVSALVFALPTAGASQPRPSAFYGPFSHGIPTSTAFFPIGVWYQDPSGGNVPAPYTDQAQAFKAMGINVFVGVSQANGLDWPESYGADQGEMAAAAAEGIYVVGGGDPSCSPANTGRDPCDTDHASVDSVQKLLASLPASDARYFAGYQWTDEPACNVKVTSEVSAIHSEDPTRMTYANEGAWAADLPNNDIGAPSGSGLTSAQCLSDAEANLVAPSIVSSDDYALTDPWHSSLCAGANCIYLYGKSASTMRALAGPAQPVWSFIETGTDDLGLSSQNGACNVTKNLCANGNEVAATPAQVNSSAWDAIINGANGIEWFCDGTVAYDACAGGGTQGRPAAKGSPTYGIAANLTYIDHTIENFAPELNSPNTPGLSVSSALPMSTMLKDVDGTYYLFAESGRDGTAAATFRDPALAGATATLVYNSAAEYGPDVYDVPLHHLTTAGVFSATFGPQYQVKVYKIT